MRLADGVDLDQIAGLTTGFTGADLANLVNEAAIVATRRNGDAVTLDDFTAAIERIVAGLEKKSRVLGPAERSRVAHHEMGHALVAASLPGVDPVHKVSIIPRGVGALGYTMQRPTEDRFLLARQELENRIAVLMGGRAAEALVFDGEVSTALPTTCSVRPRSQRKWSRGRSRSFLKGSRMVRHGRDVALQSLRSLFRNVFAQAACC